MALLAVENLQVAYGEVQVIWGIDLAVEDRHEANVGAGREGGDLGLVGRRRAVACPHEGRGLEAQGRVRRPAVRQDRSYARHRTRSLHA